MIAQITPLILTYNEAPNIGRARLVCCTAKKRMLIFPHEH